MNFHDHDLDPSVPEVQRGERQLTRVMLAIFAALTLAAAITAVGAILDPAPQQEAAK